MANKHILISEPGFYPRVQLDDELAPHGYQVTAVKRVEAAVMKMKTQVFHLLLMAYEEHVEEALRLLATLRESFNHIPVILLTKKPTETQIREVMQYRPIEIVVKPYSLFDLLGRIEGMQQKVPPF